MLAGGGDLRGKSDFYVLETSSSEGDQRFEVVAEEFGSLGFGNPDATISYDKQLESGELRAGVAVSAVELIKSGECMRSITDRDDGCIDGRCAREIWFAAEDGEKELPISDPSEHLRAKVAGGGYVTSVAMIAGLASATESIDDDLKGAVAYLGGKEMYCGLHTGSHERGDAVDCGANDKVVEILAGGVMHKEGVAVMTERLLGAGGARFDEEMMADVFAGWESAVEEYARDDTSTGKSRFEVMRAGIREAQEARGEGETVAVSKRLAGDHKEDFIVVNYREGETFSQAVFAEALAEKFPDIPDEKRAQAFVVDVWRIVQLAEAWGDGDERRYMQALHAGVAFQLATAANLTDGSLPMFGTFAK